MTEPRDPWDFESASPLRGGLLSGAVLRDIFDLNRQFVGLCLESSLRGDPCFTIPEDAWVLLRDGGPELLERLTCCPFTLFELGLQGSPVRISDASTRVEDARRIPVDAATVARVHAFANVAVFVAWRLADEDPLALRLAMGLATGAERVLNETRASDLPALANRAQLVRPRWQHHPHYWALLARAAGAASDALLRHAHCSGICMIVADLYQGAAPPHGPQRRRRR